MLEGSALAGKKLGEAVEKTPIGDHTPIGEGLQHVGGSASGFNEKKSSEIIEKLHAAKSPDVPPFKQDAHALDAPHNEPAQIAVDRQNVFSARIKGAARRQAGRD